MRTLIAVAIALAAAGAFFLAGAAHATACTACTGSLVELAAVGGVHRTADGHLGQSPVSPITAGHVSLDSCGIAGPFPPETATDPMAGGAAPGPFTPGPVLVIGALLGYALMLRRLSAKT